MSDVTLSQACALTAGGAMWATFAVPDAGIPAFTMSDGPLGIASGKVDERDIALLSPCSTLLGATWDRDLTRRVGALVGSEAVLRGVDAVLAPNLNLARSPLAGRAFEYFSEDPVLTGVLGAEWVKGLQSTGTGSVAKHLVCNDSETSRDEVDVRVDERTLREVYLLPFQYAADAGCVGLMAAYNRVNGSWCSEQAHVLTQVVKQDWCFEGLIMSDWFGTHSSEGTINAGLDLEMPGPSRFMGGKLEAAVAAGAVDPARVEDAASRIAAVARRITGDKAPPIPAAEAEALLVEAAAAGFTLLRNEGDMLPLVPGTVKTLAVIGPNAWAPCFQGGTFAKISISPDAPTPVETLRAAYGASCEILFEPGVDPQPRLPNMSVTPALDIGDGCTSGMTLEYFGAPDCVGDVLTRETRDTNSLVWFVGVHDQARFTEPGSVRASGRYTAKRAGAHMLHLGSTGAARILVDGEEVMRAGGEIPAGDVMGVLKRGDSDHVSFHLAEGQEVTIAVEFSWTGGRVQGLWYGLRGPGSAEEMLQAAVDAARAADAVFLIVGETSDSSVESKDRADTLLPAEQIHLIEAVTAANPRTAVVVNVGHAFDSAWEDRTAALLSVWYPGEGFARALADVLSGTREPGGRLPVTMAADEGDYPAFALQPASDGTLTYSEGTLLGYRGLAASGKAARHPFGSGMGYARFAWASAAVEGGMLHLTVTNTSDRTGSDVVQVYRDNPECALVGFARVELAAGESRRIAVPLEPRALQRWGEQGWEPVADHLVLRLARHCEDEGLTLEMEIAALA
ncbi:glycoside hydrolase family 3 protein [Novosphingobium aerophilum]|uniref:beta-glucosidase n=1 Tax=Novosphingobium TaxID=165696 RepID=UPI002D78B9F4|nr:glycoside hydrolase family 3 C-terminal domain-containing protein [Novosphingobium sp. RL4]WRT92059.1 glycoside hydrolase family 3 C-terminal domain-containing protein [Novosphingobium sp. RL4]